MAENEPTMKDKFSSFLSDATAIDKNVLNKAQETVKETAKQGKEFVEEKKRDYDADRIYQKLGKKVYKLVRRDELTLPECCDKYIEALNELYADDSEAEDDMSGEQESCCCSEDKCDKCEECKDND